MENRHPLEPYIAPLRALLQWFAHTHVPHVIIGGIAASLLSKPRATRDIDGLVLLDLAELDTFYNAAATFGFLPRQPDALVFAQRHRTLLLQHEPSGIDVDISLGALPFEEQTIQRRQMQSIGELAVPLPTVEDLIIMKATAHRRIDLADISALLSAHPALAVKRIRYWVKEFSRVLEMPELYKDVDALLNQHTSKKRRPRQNR